MRADLGFRAVFRLPPTLQRIAVGSLPGVTLHTFIEITAPRKGCCGKGARNVGSVGVWALSWTSVGGVGQQTWQSVWYHVYLLQGCIQPTLAAGLAIPAQPCSWNVNSCWVNMKES